MTPITQHNIGNWVAYPGGPAPLALDDIDSARGAEILVGMNMSGDGHAQVAIYTFRNGRIVRYGIQDKPGVIAFDNALIKGGSVCCIDWFACIKRQSGRLIQWLAGPLPNSRQRFLVESIYLRTRGLRFVVVRSEKRIVRNFREGSDRCAVATARAPNLPHNPKEPIPG
jgi:hypothetical protein